MGTKQTAAPTLLALTQSVLTRLGLALGAGALIVGCSSIKPDVFPQAAHETLVENRFSDADSSDNYTAIVPRVDYAREVRTSAPQLHTVVRGDTLWDISGKFLKSPWLWPKIWEFNPAINNPHLIYPGDEIALEYVDGQPRLVVTRDGTRVSSTGAPTGSALAVGQAAANGYKSGETERLSPRIRSENLENAIPTIPADAIQQFLVYPRVVTKAEWNQSPYVVGNYDGRLTSAQGHQIYARGNFPRGQLSYGVFRESKALTDPLTGELLGYEVTHVSDAKLLHVEDPSTLVIERNKLETMSGDRLMSRSEHDVAHNYVPRMPKMQGEGRIISLIDAITQSGRNQIVVLNLGKRSGVQVGDVMAIERRGGSFVDRNSRSGFETVNLPSTRTGVLMVFQTFDKVSYALVMESTRPIHIQDVVTDI